MRIPREPCRSDAWQSLLDECRGRRSRIIRNAPVIVGYPRKPTNRLISSWIGCLATLKIRPTGLRITVWISKRIPGGRQWLGQLAGRGDGDRLSRVDRPENRLHDVEDVEGQIGASAGSLAAAHRAPSPTRPCRDLPLPSAGNSVQSASVGASNHSFGEVLFESFCRRTQNRQRRSGRASGSRHSCHKLRARVSRWARQS